MYCFVFNVCCCAVEPETFSTFSSIKFQISSFFLCQLSLYSSQMCMTSHHATKEDDILAPSSGKSHHNPPECKGECCAMMSEWGKKLKVWNWNHIYCLFWSWFTLNLTLCVQYRFFLNCILFFLFYCHLTVFSHSHSLSFTHTHTHTHTHKPVTPAEAWSGNLKGELYHGRLLHSDAATDPQRAAACTTLSTQRGSNPAVQNVQNVPL